MRDTETRQFILKGIDLIEFFGSNDCNLKLINSLVSASVTARGDNLILKGTVKALDEVEKLLDKLVENIQTGGKISEQRIRYFNDMINSRKEKMLDNFTNTTLTPGSGGKQVSPKTVLQTNYIIAMQTHDVVVCIGPAGTGKTYLAVAAALSFLNKGVVRRIVLVRPAVEAGESLGFLPGDINDKVDPFMRPLSDALMSLVKPERISRLIETGVIEIVPLAYMRGRTLNNSFVILDEGQNASKMQMKMFLTRLGAGSRAVITGDITQIDLPDKNTSGLVHVQSVLASVPGVEFVYFSEQDVVRHNLVQDIIRAYEKYETVMNGETALSAENEKEAGK